MAYLRVTGTLYLAQLIHTWVDDIMLVHVYLQQNNAVIGYFIT